MIKKVGPKLEIILKSWPLHSIGKIKYKSCTRMCCHICCGTDPHFLIRKGVDWCARAKKASLNSELHMASTKSVDTWTPPAKHIYPTSTRSVTLLPYGFWAGKCSGNCWFFQIRNYLDFEIATITRTFTRPETIWK